MCGNNDNNYIYTSNYSPDPEPPKNGNGKKAVKVIVAVLALVIISGASGFGGAYIILNNSEKEIALSYAPVEEPSKITSPKITEETETEEKKESVSLEKLIKSASGDDSASLADADIIQRVTPSVALIASTFANADSGTGTGIVLSSDGYIITNCHVIQTSYQTYKTSSYNDPFENPFGFFGGSYEPITKTEKASEVTVTLSDGAEYPAEIVGSDDNTDLALLKIDAQGLIAATMGDSDSLRIGEHVLTLGYPLGLGLSASGGMVSGLEKEITVELSNGSTADMTLIQTDASINPGNSGGPLINSRGEVVGITSSKLVESSIESVGFAIPISDAIPVLDDLMNKGYVSTPKIGITGTDITSAVKRYYNLPVDEGVLVVSVESGSCADNAGIEEGDIIVAVDGKEITDMDGLIAKKNIHKPGDSMTFTLARNDGNIDVNIILDEMPQTE